LSDALADLWDPAQPNITPGAAANTVLVSVVIDVSGGAADDESDVFQIFRAIGASATCTDTAVGGRFSAFTTVAGAVATASATFLDSPGTTSTVYYTVCSTTDSTGTVNNTTPRIQVTLMELGP